MVLILALSLISGQLIKLPVAGNSGPILLDLSLAVLNIYGLIKISGHFKKPDRSLAAFFGFLAVAAIALILSPLHLTTAERLISFTYTLRLLSLTVFIWLIQSGAFPSLKQKIAGVVVWSGLVIAIMGLLQLTFLPNMGFLEYRGWDPHFFRTVSTFLDPNFVGVFFIISFLLYLESYSLSFPRKRESIKFLIPTILYLALLTTFSRSSYLMFFITLFTWGFFQKSKKLILASVFLFAGLLLGFQVYTTLVAAPRNIDRTASAGYRLSTWQQGFDLWQKSPILGMGFNAYKYGLEQYSLASNNFLTSRGATTNDSSLLFVLSTTGIIGLLAYLNWIWQFLKSRWRKFKQGQIRGLTILALMLGLLVHSFFSDSLFYLLLLTPLLLLGTTED